MWTPALLLLTLWLVACSASTKEPNYAPGRTTMVHLFEWRWTDIADECELFLGPYGYGGVQVSPVNENGIVWEPSWGRHVQRPWFERYQPVSYHIISRSGNENDFRSMVERCNRAGVRIYVDAVINHMSGDLGRGHGVGGTFFDPGALQYPGVPYSAWDFNSKEKCGSRSGDIESYLDAHQVRNCRISGLNDLDQSKDYVRGKIAEFLNRLIGFGVAGFRIDAAKHIWPGDLEAIIGRLNNLDTRFFPAGSRPFLFQEVIDLGGEPVKAQHYTHLGRITEFKYGKHLGDVIRKNFGQQLSYLKTFGEDWDMVNGNDALTFVDNHDNQRGHGARGFGTILTHFEFYWYKMAVAFMLAFPYGLPRVMSSYSWPREIWDGRDRNDWIGPPHDADFNTKNVTRNADLTCGNGWVCEHRWRQIFNMVRFRNVAGMAPLDNWWDNGSNQISFSRGDLGFIVINNQGVTLDARLKTGMSAGRYCDIISGSKLDGSCSGKIVAVDEWGFAQIQIGGDWQEPFMAIHAESKL